MSVWQEHVLSSALVSGLSEQPEGLIIPVLLPGVDPAHIPTMIRQFQPLMGDDSSPEELALKIAESIRSSKATT